MDLDQHDPNYVLWAVTIAVGVTAGNLLSNWITAEVVAYQAQKIVDQTTKAVAAQTDQARRIGEAHAADSAAAMAAAQEQQRQQRAADAIGVKLRQACSDWTRADQQLHAFTSAREAARHCQRYERYVQTGVVSTAD